MRLGREEGRNGVIWPALSALVFPHDSRKAAQLPGQWPDRGARLLLPSFPSCLIKEAPPVDC